MENNLERRPLQQTDIEDQPPAHTQENLSSAELKELEHMNEELMLENTKKMIIVEKRRKLLTERRRLLEEMKKIRFEEEEMSKQEAKEDEKMMVSYTTKRTPHTSLLQYMHCIRTWLKHIYSAYMSCNPVNFVGLSLTIICHLTRRVFCVTFYILRCLRSNTYNIGLNVYYTYVITYYSCIYSCRTPLNK